MRTLVILNPTAAGRIDSDEVRGRLERVIEADFALTTAIGDAEELAAEAARSRYDLVIAAGGDGTVREVVTGLHRGGGRPRLGIVPVGTGNDLAFGLGLPTDLERAVSVAIGGNAASLDLIRASSAAGAADDRFLANAAVAGFGGRIGDRMSPAFRRRLRPVAYPLAAVAQLGHLRPYEVRLDVDGRVIETRALMVIVANGEYAGGRLRLAPGASTGDARLDLVIVHAVSPWRLSTLVPRILTGRHAGCPGISMIRATAVRLESEPAMWINLDGDTWQAGPASFRVVPGALQVAVP
jgi:diacylglycerol kinase (ATP)